MLLGRRLKMSLDDKAIVKARAKSATFQPAIDNLYRVSTALSTIDFLRGGVYTAEHTLRAFANGHPHHLAAALSIESIRCAGPSKKPAQTDWTVRKSIELADEVGAPYLRAISYGTAGVSRYLEGKFEEAIRLIGISLRVHKDELHSVMAWDIVTMILFELRAAALVGRVSEISARVPDAIRDAQARGDLYASTMFRVGRMSWAWLALDQLEVAQAELATASDQWKQDPYQLVHYYTLQSVAECALYQDRAEDAWQRILDEQKLMGLVTKLQLSRIELAYMRGRVALEVARKRNDRAALKLARADAKALKGESAKWGNALGRLLEACALGLSDKPSAIAALTPLPASFESLDMKLFAAVVRYRLGMLTSDAALVRGSEASIRAMGIQRPLAFVRVLAPGFAEASP
jgi:eukaryotic-like serine/threonine-protein kinase